LVGPKYGSTSMASRSTGTPGGLPLSSSQPVSDKSIKTSARNQKGSSNSYLGMKMVKVYSVDKRFQDHAMLFNKYVDKYEELRRMLMDLRDFNQENKSVVSPDVTLSDQNQSAVELDLNSTSAEISFGRMRDLAARSTSVSLSRPRSTLLQILYEPTDVPYELVPAILSFNNAARLVDDLIDKGPRLRGALQLVVDDARQLRRDVLVASLGADGPESLENCLENIDVISGAIPRVNDMVKRAGEILRQLEDIDIRE